MRLGVIQKDETQRVRSTWVSREHSYFYFRKKQNYYKIIPQKTYWHQRLVLADFFCCCSVFVVVDVVVFFFWINMLTAKENPFQVRLKKEKSSPFAKESI